MSGNIPSNKVAITGIGAISPIGNSCGEILDSLRSCRDGLCSTGKIDLSAFASKVCAPHREIDFSLHMSSDELGTFTDPYLRLAISAARMALKDAGASCSESCVIVVATCNAGLNSGERQYMIKNGLAREKLTRELCMQYEFGAVRKAFAQTLANGAEIFVINTACSGSTAAVGLAASLIETGYCKTALAGGADALSLANYAGFSALKVVSASKTAPFSEPVGMNIGEGAAFWFLESAADAEKSKKVYGKVLGQSTCSDAYHATQPDPRGDGAYRTLAGTLKNSGVSIEDVGCINAHASGTLANDRAEAKGIKRFCGDAKIPVTASKSFIGHCMGATGILEATCQLLAMNGNFIPPTLHFTTPRAGCEIPVVENEPLKSGYSCFISANYAFAGNNAGILVSKGDFPAPRKFHSKKRIVISGLGALSALGENVKDILSALMEGKTGISETDKFPCPDDFKFGGFASSKMSEKKYRGIDFGGMNPISKFAAIAAREALDDAKLRIDRRNSEAASLTMSISKGANESAHMDAVLTNADRRGDISCFSNITANSTAGSVSKELELKGENITLICGAGGALQTLRYAAELINTDRAAYALASAADEIYPQYLNSYAQTGLIYPDACAKDFEMRFDDAFKTVLGEGAASILLEDIETATARGAEIYGELLSYKGATDTVKFADAPSSPAALERCASCALEQAGVRADEIDLVVYTPQGNSQDIKYIELKKRMFPNAAMLTTVFNTGNLQAASPLLTLAECLYAVKNNIGPWPQKTGIGELDAPCCRKEISKILCMDAGFYGNCSAAVISARVS